MMRAESVCSMARGGGLVSPGFAIRPFRSRQRGLALVLVLWMVAALLVTATGIVYAVRSEVRAVSSLREMAAAGAAAEAGIVLAARAVSGEQPPGFRFRRIDVDFEQQSVAVRAIPLSGLIDLNSATEALLTELIAIAGEVDRAQAASLAQRIVDWRDADDQPLPAGAEDAAYAGAGSPFRTRGGPFEAPEDLLQVLGVDFELYTRLRPLVTVHARGDGRVDPAAAPEPVLRVLAGGNDEIASAYVAARESGGALADTTRFPAAFRARAQSPRYLFEASVRLANGASLVTRRVIDLASAQDGLPWQTLWAERVVEEGS
jgi:general secretion pathway protein K